MTRKAKAAGERRQRNFTPWESDRVTPSSPSSLDVLMQWLSTPGNALRWRQARVRKGLCQEVLAALEGHGISNRALGDVDLKVRVLERKFMSASAFLTTQKEAFERGDADVVKHVLRLCPQYRELLTVFGRDSTDREADVAAAQSNGATSSPTEAGEGMQSAAGKWKESLEKNRPRTTSEENADGDPSGIVKQNNAANGGSKEKESAGTVIGVAVDASGKQGFDVGEQKKNINGKQALVEKEDGTLAGIEEDQSEDEQKTQVHVESEGESSEEEEHGPAATTNKYALKMKQHEVEESSSEEESSDDNQEGRGEDEEERNPLAQLDEEQEEANEIKAYEDGESDEEEEDVEEEEGDEGYDDEEEEAEEDQVNASSDDSESSSSENEEGNDEVEAAPTPKASASKSSDHDEEVQHDSENDDEMDEGDQKHSDYDAESPVHSRKRSCKESPSPHAKRARSVIRDLEREAYIQRAKQEQAQRQQLFQLERAKLECELEAKRVHLAMEKTLARRKLLGAGVDPAEVDRVLR